MGSGENIMEDKAVLPPQSDCIFPGGVLENSSGLTAKPSAAGSP